MIQNKMYKYLGRNGNIMSPILLEKIEPIPMIKLVAEEGKILTNGYEKAKIKYIFTDELVEWYEIEEPEDKKD